MTARNYLQQVRQSLDAKVRRFHADSLCRYIAEFCSKPLAMTDRPAVVIAPHQDDETLGCGGLIALKRQMGVQVLVIFLTDGANSHTDRPDVQAISPGELTRTRRREAIKALDILGVCKSDIHFLNAPDGMLEQLEESDRKCLIDHLVSLISPLRSLELYVPHRKDRHKDHEATWGLVQEALSQVQVDYELYQYVIWMPWRSPILWKCSPYDLRGGHCLEIESVLKRKMRAIDAYCSQHDVLPRGFLCRFGEPYEVFFRSEKTAAASAKAGMQRC